VRQGKVGIDQQQCWVDVLAFEELAGKAEATMRGEPELSALLPIAAALEDVYRGDLLPRDKERPWLSAPRHRLRARFLHLLLGLGAALERGGESDRAIALYWRGTQIDSAAEPLYQRLMVCYHRTGRRPEAEDAYRRHLCGTRSRAPRCTDSGVLRAIGHAFSIPVGSRGGALWVSMYYPDPPCACA